jgi:hypothetical protein
VALLAVGCSSANAPGPLGAGGTPSRQCVTAPRGHVITMGINVLENHSTTPVTVRSVTLRQVHGLRMGKPWAVPVFSGYYLVGVVLTWPPSTRPWDFRMPAIGAVVRPHGEVNIAFPLTRTVAGKGTSAGMVVVYTAGSSIYTMDSQTALVISPDCYKLGPGVGLRPRTARLPRQSCAWWKEQEHNRRAVRTFHADPGRYRALWAPATNKRCGILAGRWLAVPSR